MRHAGRRRPPGVLCPDGGCGGRRSCQHDRHVELAQGRAVSGPGQLSLDQTGQRSGAQGQRAKDIAYPDSDSPGVLLKFGTPVEGGAGPDGDIVAFSTFARTRVFRSAIAADDRTLNCPGHYSRFDAEKGGLQIWATPRRTCRSSGFASIRTATSTRSPSTS